MSNHGNRAHALLSSSGSERWFNCTPSAVLEDRHGVRKDSPYALEGTLAHELGELLLRRDVLDAVDEDSFIEKLTDIMQNKFYSDDMLIQVGKYVEYCSSQFEAAKTITPDATMLVEQRIDLRAYIPESFGTDDCIIVADGVMEVIDLKYGKGIPVSATANKQLMLYGIGALEKLAFMYDVHSVRLTVVQPRLDSISSWVISVDDLTQWADTDLRQKAKLAFAGEGELTPGNWCKFCSVSHSCKKLAEDNLAIINEDFSEPRLLSDSEISDILLKADQFSSWIDSVVSWATAEAINNNKQWPGFKVVEGLSRRKWVDEQLVVKEINAKCPNLENDDIYTMKLKSITEIEKLLSKKTFAELLSNVVVKPAGNPVLVRESDKRPPIGLGQAINDFSQ